MPRQRRFILPGIALHITQRGNNRADCFRRDSDYLVYLLHLKELSASADCAVHAYCLMTNHVHLLVTPASGNACATLMRDLGQRYVQYFNRRYSRSGTLWEGRFHSSVVGSPEYVLACYRYIELNPVWAGMVTSPGAHPWSSHAVNIGRTVNDWLVPHADFLSIGGPAAYLRIFDDDLPAATIAHITDAIAGGYPLGSDAFKQGLEIDPRRLKRGRAGRPAARG